jgi:hypothetical protein
MTNMVLIAMANNDNFRVVQKIYIKMVQSMLTLLAMWKRLIFYHLNYHNLTIYVVNVFEEISNIFVVI